MLLDHILTALGPHRVKGDVRVDVGGICSDSRSVKPTDLFVATRGAHFDARSVTAGLEVRVVVAEAPFEVREGVVAVEVPDAGLALARVAAAFYEFPSRRFPVVGVTGTNGKTTLTWLVEAIVRAAGGLCGVIGTTGARCGSWEAPLQHTTPAAPEVQRLLADMLARGATAAAMEVSSIGLLQQRVDGTDFAVGVFTNLSRDHLDVHGTMEAYGAAKARLFHELLAPTATAVLHRRDPVHVAMRPVGRRTWTYEVAPSLEASDADIVGQIVERTIRGSRVVVRTPAGEGTFVLKLLGDHNVENALGALGAGLALGLELEACLEGLGALGRVPGRLDAVHAASGFSVVVDYAHTPDALERVLVALRPLTAGRLWLVFGCGGDRDPGKRPLMGRVAVELSDEVIVTSDNPRSEDPEVILDHIARGFESARHAPQRVVDRHEAILRALTLARPGDLVVIAGKGHETTQTIGDRVLPFDDRAVVLAALGEAA